MSAAQTLIKNKYNHINGLKSTQYQLKSSLQNVDHNLIQILHVGDNHWSVISTLGQSDKSINHYDSIYSSLPDNAEDIISCLFSVIWKFRYYH
jgi:hypothetical protein